MERHRRAVASAQRQRASPTPADTGDEPKISDRAGAALSGKRDFQRQSEIRPVKSRRARFSGRFGLALQIYRIPQFFLENFPAWGNFHRKIFLIFFGTNSPIRHFDEPLCGVSFFPFRTRRRTRRTVSYPQQALSGLRAYY